MINLVHAYTTHPPIELLQDEPWQSFGAYVGKIIFWRYMRDVVLITQISLAYEVMVDLDVFRAMTRLMTPRKSDGWFILNRKCGDDGLRYQPRERLLYLDELIGSVRGSHIFTSATSNKGLTL